MSGIAVRLWCHDEFRQVACWACRRLWNEQLLGITLCDGRDVVGSLCPACLLRSPREVAAEIGGYGFALQAAIARDRLEEAFSAARELLEHGDLRRTVCGGRKFDAYSARGPQQDRRDNIVSAHRRDCLDDRPATA